jgi:hypothetical protein
LALHVNTVRYLALAAFGLAALYAQPAVRLTGKVVNENNAPVAAARVRIDQVCQTTTDPAGGFNCSFPVPGEYAVRIEREGYFDLAEEPITVEYGDQEVTFVLNPLREIFESIEIKANAGSIDTQQTASTETVSGNDLIAVPYPTTNNLKNAMRIVPGVVQDPRGGIHLNGGAEEQALYTLDGFNVGDPLSGRFEARLSIEAVQTMEVSSRRYSAEYGKGSAGVFAIRTTPGDDRVRYTATNFLPGIENRKGLLIGNWTPRFGISGPLRPGRIWLSSNATIIYDKQVIEELPKGQDRTSSWRFSNLMHGQVNVTPSNILYSGFLVTSWNAPRTGLTALDPMETTVDRRTRQWFWHVKNQKYFSRGALVEVGYARNRTFGREIPQGHELFRLTPEGRRGNFFADALRKGSRDQWLLNVFLPTFARHQIKGGIDIDRVGYEQDLRRTGYVHYRSDGTPQRVVRFGGPGALSKSNLQSAIYLQDAWRVRPSLVVEFGVRSDWDNLVHNWNTSPRISASWAPPGLENARFAAGYAVVYDANHLRMFTRPLDQYSTSTTLGANGEMVRQNAISYYLPISGPLRTGRYQNWSAAWEQLLPWRLATRFEYFRKRGRDGLTFVNTLQPDVTPPDYRLVDAFPPLYDGIYTLGNDRRDVYDAVTVSVRQPLGKAHAWMASYTRSRAHSNAVVDIAIDDPLLISNNIGPMPWDAPNRLISWGYMPTPWPNWSIAYLFEWRTGFPFSVVSDEGGTIGDLNSLRFPDFLEFNFHLERRFVFKKHRFAIRGGFNNILDHENYNVVNNNAASPNFLKFYGGQGRTMNFRLRWLGKN